MEQSVEEKQAKLKDVEKWYKEQQDTLQEYNDRMAKIKTSLAATTKTKDYLVRQKALENLRRPKQTKEDEINKVKETINDFRDAISRDIARIKELNRDAEREGGATWDQVHQLKETIAQISTKRSRLLAIVPGNILRRYEQIRDRRDGLAIVDASEGTCLGCHVQLRPQQYNVVLRLETLESCPICQRFVFVRPDFAAQVEHDEGPVAGETAD